MTFTISSKFELQSGLSGSRPLDGGPRSKPGSDSVYEKEEEAEG